MKSEEVVVKIESSQSEEEADRTDGQSGGTPEASSLAELAEESHVRAEDDGKRRRKKAKKTVKKAYPCRFCGRVFDQGQALGGHMNAHPDDRNKEKVVHYEKLLQKMKYPRSFTATVNPREYVQETSSYPISNFNQPGDDYNVVPMEPKTFIQQPRQQMEPSQPWLVDPQLFGWPQASTNDINLKEPTNNSSKMPNLSATHATFDGTMNGNYEPQPINPSMSRLPSEHSVPPPNSISSNNLICNSIACGLCNPLGVGTYQDPNIPWS